MSARTRQRLGLAAALLLAGVLRPEAARATDLELGLRGEAGYDDNTFSRVVDPQDDVPVRFSPRAEVVERQGDLQWSLRYRPEYEYFLDANEAEGWTHRVEGDGTWRINSTTTLEVSDRFDRFESISRAVLTQTEADGVVDTTVEFGTQRFKRNEFEATLRHYLSPTRSLSLTGTHRLNDYGRETRSDSMQTSLTGQLFQKLSERTGLGGGLSWSRQSLDESEVRPEDSTDFYNLFGRLRYLLDPVTELNLSAGPTLVDRDDPEAPPAVLEGARVPIADTSSGSRLILASSCPTLSDGTRILAAGCDAQTLVGLAESEADRLSADLISVPLQGEVPTRGDSSITFFANASLTRKWENGQLGLSYRRQESDTSGLGSSTIADIVRLFGEWNPSKRWRFRALGLWNRREQSAEGVSFVRVVQPTSVTLPCDGSDLGGGFCQAASGEFVVRPITVGDVAEQVGFRALERDNDVEVTQIVARLDVHYRLTKRVRLIGRAIYLDQSVDDRFDTDRDFDRFRIVFGIDYQFDPLHL